LHNGRRIQAPRREFQHRYHLFPRNVKPLHDFVNVAPASRFSNTIETGIRVSLNTHAPLTLPGMLSTAGHCDQSRLAMICAPPLRIPLCGGGAQQSQIMGEGTFHLPESRHYTRR
jgi:hypothetical protein